MHHIYSWCLFIVICLLLSVNVPSQPHKDVSLHIYVFQELLGPRTTYLDLKRSSLRLNSHLQSARTQSSCCWSQCLVDTIAVSLVMIIQC